MDESLVNEKGRDRAGLTSLQIALMRYAVPIIASGFLN